MRKDEELLIKICYRLVKLNNREASKKVRMYKLYNYISMIKSFLQIQSFCLIGYVIGHILNQQYYKIVLPDINNTLFIAYFFFAVFMHAYSSYCQKKILRRIIQKITN